MNIALILERMAPTRGGLETSTAQIAEALAQRGHAVTILCESGDWASPGVTVQPLGVSGKGRAARLASFVKRVQAEIADRAFDVTHAMLPIPGVDIYEPRGGTIPAQRATSRRRRGALAGKLAALGFVFNAKRRKMAALEKAVVEQGDTICLGNSPKVTREFGTYYQRPANSLSRTIFNTVDCPDVDDAQRAQWRDETRVSLGCDETTTLFLTVAKNFTLKGVDFAIRAFAQWQSEQPGVDAKLVVVGRKEVETYRRLARACGVEGSVTFLPPVSPHAMWPLFAGADAVVLLSWYDACSRVVLEATRWGIPSMTTRYNGAAEILAEGAGIVVDSPDALDEIEEGLDTLADGSKRRDCHRACEAVADHLSRERHLNELLELYAEACQR